MQNALEEARASYYLITSESLIYGHRHGGGMLNRARRCVHSDRVHLGRRGGAATAARCWDASRVLRGGAGRGGLARIAAATNAHRTKREYEYQHYPECGLLFRFAANCQRSSCDGE